MTLDGFIDERRTRWQELETLVKKAKGRPERLGATGVLRLGNLYRAVSADLAIARRLYPLDPIVGTLDELVGRSRHLVYASATRKDSLVDFFATGYWRRAMKPPIFLGIAAVLLVVPAVMAALWAYSDPGRASGLVPNVFRSVTEPRPHGAHIAISTAASALTATQIFTNNIKVTFVAFAGGLTLGTVTGLALIYNGALLGVVAGLGAGAGNGDVLIQLLVPHGVLELSCIVVAGAAGLRMGWAIIEPGRATRVASLSAEARKSVDVVLGTAAWLVLAGLVEGFVTPVGIGVVPALAVGLGLAVLYWSLMWWRGRPRAETGSLP